MKLESSGEQPLQVARCTKIINADSDDPKYIINVKQFAKFVVDLGDQVAPTDIEEGMRVGYVYYLRKLVGNHLVFKFSLKENSESSNKFVKSVAKVEVRN